MLVVTRHAVSKSLLAVATCVIVAGCLGDAERGNLLDPLSGNYDEFGAVAGTVSTFYAPFEGISGVRVSLTSLSDGGERAGVTGASGRFSITDVPAGPYQISTDRPGYASVVDTVSVEIGRLVELSLPINGIPVAEITTIHTENLNRWFPQDPLFQLVVEAFISDPDGLGDVDDVRFSAPSLGYSDTLRVVVGEPGVYRRIFANNELPVPAQELLGRPLQVEASDNQGAQGMSASVQIVRILASFPQAVSPTVPDVEGPNPNLIWRLFDLPFSFTHRVDIAFVPVPGQEIPLARYSEIAPTDTTFTIPDALQQGSYSWTVSAVDIFGNLSRSRPLAFDVAPASLRP